MTFTNPYAWSYISYFIIFTVLSGSLLSLSRIQSVAKGAGLWSLSFLLNGIGFACWTMVPFNQFGPWFVIGDFIHLCGFLAHCAGVLLFTGTGSRKVIGPAVAGTILAWLAGILLLPVNAQAGFGLLILVRSCLLIGAGWLILGYQQGQALAGRFLAGWGTIAWGLHCLTFAFLWQYVWFRGPGLALLVALHVAAAMGLVVMAVDRLHTRAEFEEQRAWTLEGLLPICSQCKKIRNSEGQWETLETYISRRSEATFSHGLCNDCLKAMYPEFADQVLARIGQKS